MARLTLINSCLHLLASKWKLKNNTGHFLLDAHTTVDTDSRKKSGLIVNAIKIFARSSLFTSPASLLARYASKMWPSSNNNTMQPVKIAARNRLLQSLVSLAGAFIDISAIGYVTFPFSVPLMLAPFGASVVLLFSVYDSPLAQPRNTVLGHVLAAFIGGVTAVIHSTLAAVAILWGLNRTCGLQQRLPCLSPRCMSCGSPILLPEQPRS